MKPEDRTFVSYLRLIRKFGGNVGYSAWPIIELEHERDRVFQFPSHYVIFGLGLVGRKVYWSVEPMCKPERGDCYNDCWLNGEEAVARSEFFRIRRGLCPGMQKLGLSWGTQVDQIDEVNKLNEDLYKQENKRTVS